MGWIKDKASAASDWTEDFMKNHPALTGAISGGAVGSVIPIVGTITGAVSGAALGYYIGRDDDQKPKE
jgi:phage tail tape-measure protein